MIEILLSPIVKKVEFLLRSMEPILGIQIRVIHIVLVLYMVVEKVPVMLHVPDFAIRPVIMNVQNLVRLPVGIDVEMRVLPVVEMSVLDVPVCVIPVAEPSVRILKDIPV